jgi:hypothetical protein
LAKRKIPGWLDMTISILYFLAVMAVLFGGLWVLATHSIFKVL